MKKKVCSVLLVLCMAAGITGCASKSDSGKTEAKADTKQEAEETEIQVFNAASLNTVMQELAEA